jgi:uncharacterized membrane protein YphA (DoxX/SURF4 family)
MAGRCRLLLIHGCRFLLAAVFAMAGVSKLADTDGFSRSLANHSGFDPFWVALIAAGLPWLELTCSLCLLFGYAVREAALIVGVLLVLFSAYAVRHWGERSCGCFMLPIVVEVSWWPLLRNLLLLAASVLVAWKGTDAKRTTTPGASLKASGAC